jgi:hypothetical protein
VDRRIDATGPFGLVETGTDALFYWRRDTDKPTGIQTGVIFLLPSGSEPDT